MFDNVITMTENNLEKIDTVLLHCTYFESFSMNSKSSTEGLR